MATFRSSDAEIQAAQRAREFLYEADTILGMLGPYDPLRRALLVACRAITLGLWASPVLRHDGRRGVVGELTVLEQGLPHGIDALERVDERAAHTESALQTLYERAEEMPAGRAARRKVLIEQLVVAATHMHAVLLGTTRAGVFLPAEATPETLRLELEKLCSVSDCAQFKDLESLPSFLYSFTESVSFDFRLRYGVELDPEAVMNALAGLIQDEERLRRASAPSARDDARRAV